MMKGLYFHLYAVDALSRDQLRLPTLPDVALRVSEMCQDPNTSLQKLASEIATDPATAARLIRVANSAAYGGAPVDTLLLAVSRIGLVLTRTLINRFVLEQMFVSRNPALNKMLRVCWARSIEVAALASGLARSRTQLNPATALLAGLTREIGVLPLIRLADEKPELVDSPGALVRSLQQLQGRVGVYLLRKWGFTPELAEIPLTSADLKRQHTGPCDYADVVCVAALREQWSRQGLLSRMVRPHVPALEKLALTTNFELTDDPHAAAQLDQDRQLLAA